MLRRFLVLAFLASPALYGADKTAETMLEVLRDLDGMQQQMKAMQASLESKLAGLAQSGAEQTHAAADQAAKSLSALGDHLQNSLQTQQNQQSKTLDAVAAMGTQIQAISDQLSTVRQAIGDLNASVSRISTQLQDLQTSLKSNPPSTSGPAQPELSATDLFANAEGDRLGGKLPLALQEYTDYVSKFGDTPQASDAQYYVGSIHYSSQEWGDAVKAFDTLLQKYPDSKRTPETLYYKADSLARLGRWQEANDALKDLRRRFPDSPLAQQALTVTPPK
ncbi:MAG TPA: tetratricopeptide repeat protein [Bryobacteraceae bacterium]|jgi:TolA-binding protein|nr:tetratricopeptide repeat protein [Bryobacteraceae bacterium]